MKTSIFLFLLFLVTSCVSEGPSNLDLQQQIEIADSLSRQRDLLQQQAIIDANRKADSLEAIVMHMKDKTAVLDSLVQRRAFKRDFWGKAGAFGKGLLGIPTFNP